MSTPSPLDEGLTPERLTETLRASGGLDGGRVAEVIVETSRTTILSTIERVRLRYDGGEGPATLIRKQPRGDVDSTLRALLSREVAFYEKVAPAMPTRRVDRHVGRHLGGTSSAFARSSPGGCPASSITSATGWRPSAGPSTSGCWTRGRDC